MRAFGAAASPPGDAVALGLTLPYVRAALITSFAVGAAGLASVHALLRRDHGRRVAFTTTVLVFAATPLVWYMVYEASMTHAASFGAVAVLVLARSALVAPRRLLQPRGPLARWLWRPWRS